MSPGHRPSSHPPQPIIRIGNQGSGSMARTNDARQVVRTRQPLCGVRRRAPSVCAALRARGVRERRLSAIKGRDAVKLDAARTALRRALAKALYEHVDRARGHRRNHARHLRGEAARAGARRGGRGVRRVPAPRRHRSVADERRAPRDPEGHVPDAQRRQPPEAVLHGRRSALGRHGVPGQGLPLARPGSDLRRRDSPEARRQLSQDATAPGAATCWRR